MGRKAKLKKMRHSAKTTGKTQQKYDSTQFVEQFDRLGYKIEPNSEKKRQDFPEIPKEKIEPQI